MRLKKTPIEGQCRIAGCKDSARLRGFCKPHYQEAYRRRLLDSIGLPSARRGRKPAVVPDEVTPPVVVPAVAPQIGTLDTLRTERDAANTRAEAAEKARASLDAEVIEAWQKVNDLDMHLKKARDYTHAVDSNLARLKHGICESLGIDQDGGTSWVLAQLRKRIEGDAAKLVAANEFEDLLRAEHAKTLPWLRAAKECAAALGVTTPEELIEGAKALSLDQHPPAMIQRPGLPALPEPKPHRVKQAGGRDLGVLVGYLDQTGLFRVTDGPQKGAAYGCLYSVEPVDQPTQRALGEPREGAEVWVRTRIDIVTGSRIYLDCGGNLHRSRWTPENFACVTDTTTDTDDIPF